MPLSRKTLLGATTEPALPPWLDHVFFAGMDPSQLEALLEHMEELVYGDGEYVVHERARADALFVITRGSVAVVRENDDGRHVLHEMGEGELFGELGMFLDKVRTASIVAVGEATLLRLPFAALVQGDAGESISGHLSGRLLRNVNKVLALRTKNLSDNAVTLLRERLQMGQFFVSLICLLVVYTLGLSLENTYEEQLAGYGPLVSILLLAVIALICTVQIRLMGWSLDRFGVHLRGAKAALTEAAWLTAAVLTLLTLGKWLLIQLHPSFADVPLIGIGSRLETYGLGKLLLLGASYALFAPVQEFIARGVLQTSLASFLSFRRSTLAAIILSNTLFAALHLHVSYTLAGLALASGLLWGAMFARHPTLVGVCASHVVIGLYTIYVLASSPL